MTVDGVTGITSASNTVANAIPGVTFQLLSTGTASSDGTPETVQVVIDNDTTSIETAINTFVTDYNATMKAINAQEGKELVRQSGAAVWHICSGPVAGGFALRG